MSSTCPPRPTAGVENRRHYTLPVRGKSYSHFGGAALKPCPLFADGKRIASKRPDGIENIWSVKGRSDLRQYKGTTDRCRIPLDARRPVIVGRKHFRNTRRLGAGRWVDHTGGGAGLKITDSQKLGQKAPTNSVPDPLAIHGRRIDGKGFQYNRNRTLCVCIQRLIAKPVSGEHGLWKGDGPGAALSPMEADDYDAPRDNKVCVSLDMESGRERRYGWNGPDSRKQGHFDCTMA